MSNIDQSCINCLFRNRLAQCTNEKAFENKEGIDYLIYVVHRSYPNAMSVRGSKDRCSLEGLWFEKREPISTDYNHDANIHSEYFTRALTTSERLERIKDAQGVHFNPKLNIPSNKSISWYKRLMNLVRFKVDA